VIISKSLELLGFGCVFLKATGGFEPPDKGFADLCLTTWLRRPTLLMLSPFFGIASPGKKFFW
jgi:hypothetical protein